MANTVSSLSYANTFGDWMVTTNNLVVENNILAKDNYVKDSGTLYLSESSQSALQSNGNVIVQKVFSVQGIGSSASIQNNLDVQGQGYFTNGNLSIATTGSVNVGKTLNVLGTDNSLIVSNNAIIGGNIAISFATITRTLQANNTVNTSNASIVHTVYTNKLQANTSTLTDIAVANSSVFTNYLQSNTNILTAALHSNNEISTTSASVTGTTWTNVLQANNSTNTSNANIVWTVSANAVQGHASVNTSNASVVNTTYTKFLQANTSTNTSNASIVWTLYANNVQANATVNTTTASITGTTFTDGLQANTQANTQTLSVTETAFVNILEANSAVNTTTLSVFSTTHTEMLQANSAANTRTMSVTGVTHTDVLQANSAANTRTMSVTGTTHTDVLQANSAANTRTMSVTGTTHTDVLQANSAANTRTMSVTGVTHTDVLQANSAANTRTMSVTGTTHTDLLVANTRINTVNVWSTHTVTANTIRANSDVFTPNVRVSELIDAEDAEARVFNLQVGEGGLSIAGNFTLNGRTIFNSNEFILSQGTPNQTSKFTVFRTANGAANGVASNASIRWNETDNYFDINDVDIDGVYYRIITEQQLSDSTTTVSSITAASSTAANTLSDAIQTANTFLKARIDSADSFANSAFVRANSGYGAANSGASFANGAFDRANAAYAAANNVAPQIAPAFAQANAAFAKANAATSEIKGTTGSVSPTSASLTLTSNNGVQIYATTANTLAISTSQNLQVAASPTFAGLTLTGTPLGTSSGGTGSTSPAGALQTLLRESTGGYGTSGQVLATGGTGSFYWTTAASGGGGTTPGTRINSTRLSHVGDGTTTLWDIPTASQVNQVRVYINGVRQLDSEYSLNLSTSKITFSVAPVLGDKILIEVDGYIIYDSNAGNLAYTPSGTLTSDTIQDAIDSLESAKMPKSGGTFTGQILGLTMPTTTSNTTLASTQFVNNLANSSYTFSHSISGNAGTVTNGVYSNSTYANPTFITSLSATKLSLGTIPSATLGNSSLFIGTTSIALNRATGSQTLSGVSIDGSAASATTLTGVAQVAGYSVSGQDVSYNGAVGPQIMGQPSSGVGGGASAISFHRPGIYAVNFGLGTDNQLRVGGWSRGGATGESWVVLDSGNFNSYAPKKDGTGATGNWNITAARASDTDRSNNLTQSFNSNWNTDFTHTTPGSTVLRGDTSTGSSTNGPGGSWWFQQNMRHTNASNAWGVQVAWGWEDNANLLKTRNIQAGVYGSWVTYINSTNIGSQSVSYATSAGDSTKAAGLDVHAGRNSEANKIVRTDKDGYIQAGYINSDLGNEGKNASPPRVWGVESGSDHYLRTYLTSALSVGYAATAGSAPASGGTSGAVTVSDNNTDATYRVCFHSGNLIYSTSGVYVNASTDALFTTGNITAYASDKRLKGNINTIQNALYKVCQISGVTYDWNKNTKELGFTPSMQSETGVLAQEIEKVIPDAVTIAPFDRDENGNSKSGENYLTVHYEKIIPLLIESIKELKAEVETLKGQIK